MLRIIVSLAFHDMAFRTYLANPEYLFETVSSLVAENLFASPCYREVHLLDGQTYTAVLVVDDSPESGWAASEAAVRAAYASFFADQSINVTVGQVNIHHLADPFPLHDAPVTGKLAVYVTCDQRYSLDLTFALSEAAYMTACHRHMGRFEYYLVRGIDADEAWSLIFFAEAFDVNPWEHPDLPTLLADDIEAALPEGWAQVAAIWLP